MHGYWWINDPDCLLLRNTLHFTNNELIGMASIKAITGGSFILSDDLQCISNDRLLWVKKLLPPCQDHTVVPIDLFTTDMPELFRVIIPSQYSRQLKRYLITNEANKTKKSKTRSALHQDNSNHDFLRTNSGSFASLYSRSLSRSGIAFDSQIQKRSPHLKHTSSYYEGGLKDSFRILVHQNQTQATQLLPSVKEILRQSSDEGSNESDAFGAVPQLPDTIDEDDEIFGEKDMHTEDEEAEQYSGIEEDAFDFIIERQKIAHVANSDSDHDIDIDEEEDSVGDDDEMYAPETVLVNEVSESGKSIIKQIPSQAQWGDNDTKFDANPNMTTTSQKSMVSNTSLSGKIIQMSRSYSSDYQSVSDSMITTPRAIRIGKSGITPTTISYHKHEERPVIHNDEDDDEEEDVRKVSTGELDNVLGISTALKSEVQRHEKSNNPSNSHEAVLSEDHYVKQNFEESQNGNFLPGLHNKFQVSIDTKAEKDVTTVGGTNSHSMLKEKSRTIGTPTIYLPPASSSLSPFPERPNVLTAATAIEVTETRLPALAPYLLAENTERDITSSNDTITPYAPYDQSTKPAVYTPVANPQPPTTTRYSTLSTEYSSTTTGNTVNVPPPIKISKKKQEEYLFVENECDRIKEYWLDKYDLLKQTIVFVVCNWSNNTSSNHQTSPDTSQGKSANVSNAKTQFVSLETIFGTQILEDYITYTHYLYNPIRKQIQSRSFRYNSQFALQQRNHGLSAKMSPCLFVRQPSHLSPQGMDSKSIHRTLTNSKEMLMRSNSDESKPPPNTFAQTNSSNPANSIQHIVHMFNFWTSTYSYKVMTLCTRAMSLSMKESYYSAHHEDESRYEIAFSDVPHHSLSLYSISISLHPLLPRYLGSNIHWSCNQEIAHAYLSNYHVHHPEIMQFCEEFSRLAVSRSHKRGHGMNRKGAMNSNMMSASMASMSMDMWQQRTVSSSTTTASIMTNSTPTYMPVINSMAIEFMDHMLFPSTKTSNTSAEIIVHQQQAIWVYLPISIKRSKTFGHVLGHVILSGNVLSHLNPAQSSNNSASSIPFVREEYRGHVEVIEYIEESSCRGAGYVYKITVSGVSVGQGSPSTDPKVDKNNGIYGREKEELIISWISDMEEIAQPMNISESFDLFA